MQRGGKRSPETENTGAKGQGWEGRGVLIKGVKSTARRIVGGARTGKAWQAVRGESWALVIMNE